MHIVDFRKFLNLFESIDQLDEDLGDLRNLNAGNLLNVFKQQSQSADAPSFVRSWSGPLLGQNSEMVDLGKIKSWKDLRKASAKNPDLIGAIFYVDGQAFASINYRDPAINMRAPTSTVIFAFDPSKLPELAQEEPPEGLSGWALERWQDDQKRRIPRGTAYEKRDWKDKLQKVTGNAVELRQLEQYLDRVIALFPDNEFTAVGLTVDKSGQQKTKDRRERKDVTDPLAGRVKRNTWDHGPSDNLKKALDKYKASKEFDNFSMPEQVVEFLSDINNYKKTFVYKDNRYAYDVKDAKISIPVSYLLMNKTFTFDARIESLNTTGYGSSLYVTYQVDDNGTVTPIKIH